MVQRRNLFVAAIVALIAALVLGGCARPRISGRVIDNFGSPVDGVTVLIADERHTATTDADGRYSIRFKPGRLTLRAMKAGYMADSLIVTLDERRPFEARTLELFRIPQSKGVFAIGPDDYVPLARGSIGDQSWERDEGWRADHVYQAEGDLTVLGKGRLQFVDNSGLPKIVLVKSDADGRIGEMATGFMGAVESSDFDIIEDDQIYLDPMTILREVDLEPGYYVFVEWQDILFAPARPGSVCYRFKVE
ncbi:hypothetical protein AMJ71_06485 [candidate division TA06 bacterium SM1_40]|uniref:Carboxypeptidase regulatory-like domain-containing protein n=1 Tax=candidate division TA06 bacterium SM1_40 TaxID=1703773 RepID=A0A0S8JIK3_UNCT6|nr:MAG: hypothetical protein AMJ71_06485 [candidate division TA06 bacterium SM1_40]